MGLDFGWRFNDVREGIWKGDKALQNVSAGALGSWEEDGDAAHLRPYATLGEPTVFTFKALDLDRSYFVAGIGEGTFNGADVIRQWIMCFRIGVDFPGGPEESPPDAKGVRHPRIVREKGVRMLSEEFVAGLELKNRGIVEFYGKLIWTATFASEQEKKALSPPSTGTPSSGAGTMKGSTEATAAPEGAAA